MSDLSEIANYEIIRRIGEGGYGTVYLAKLKNTVLSTAIVPVGITRFRKDGLKQVDKKCAEETIAIASRYKRVCCSDEFFLLAEREIPPAKYYGNFAQLDDGVGALLLLLEDFKTYKLPAKLKQPLNFIFATSYAAKHAMEKIAARLNKIQNLTCSVHPVKSDYWGKDITVAGLITTDDLIRTIKNIDADFVVIPSVMLRPYSEDFLDGKNLDYVRKMTGMDFFVVQNIYSMGELAEYIKTFA